MSTTAKMTTNEIFDVTSEKPRNASNLAEELKLHVSGYFHWWLPVKLRKNSPRN